MNNFRVAYKTKKNNNNCFVIPLKHIFTNKLYFLVIQIGHQIYIFYTKLNGKKEFSKISEWK